MAGVDNRSGALAHIDDETLLARIQAGEKPSHIAAQLGVHKSAIYHRFANRPEYIRARENGTEVRIEEAEHEIETAADQFTLSRARELFRAVAWRAEREFPSRWGAKTQLQADLSITVNVVRGVAETPNDAVHSAITGECDRIEES